MDVYRVLKKPFFGRYQRPWRWPDQAAPGDWERIRFASDRGATLVGLFGRALAQPAKGTIVCAHPMGAEAKGYYLKRGHAAMLRRNGYNVFAFDFNGFGESSSGGFDYPADVLASARAAQEASAGLPLGVLGVSFGAAWALCALSRGPSPFRAVVAEAAFTTLDEYWRRYPVPYATLKCLNVVLPDVADCLRPIARVPDVAERMLLIYGQDDDITPARNGERLLSASRAGNGGGELWVVPGAAHTRAYEAAPERYEQKVVGFFDCALA